MKSKIYSFYWAILPIIGLFSANSLAAQIDPDSRWNIRDFYKAVYFHGTDAEMGWTGNYGFFDSGAVSAEWLDATLVRINFFREMGGVPSDIVFDPLLNAKCQDSAMIQSGQGFLSHFPNSQALFWTQDGYDAAASGNISIGVAGAEAITGFMVDPGSSNFKVGHRRWFLLPNTTIMGNGDVPGSDIYGYQEANTVWVIQDPIPAFRPTPRNDFISWPPVGHVPSDLVWGRWSITYPNADFSGATVTMESGGNSIPLVIEHFTPLPLGGLPEPTLVWIPNGMDTSSRVNWPTPSTDEVVNVTVSNIMVDGSPLSFSYSVTIFDADMPGNEETLTEITAPASFGTNTPVSFSASTRAWSEEIQARVIETEAFSEVYGAENGVNPFLVDITSAVGYTGIHTDKAASGSSSFILVHPLPVELQTLTLPDTFVINSSSASLDFQSSLAWAGEGEVARVEINTGSGWGVIWSQSGLVQTNNAFTPVNVDLSPWEGTSAQFRFVYDYLFNNLSFFAYPQLISIGWSIDDIALSGVRRVTASNATNPVAGDTFQITFTDEDPVFLQAREYVFGGFPLEWGPLLEVTPSSVGPYTVPVGVWTDDPQFGWLYGFADGWAYSPVWKWLQFSTYPWVYSAKDGWMFFVLGSPADGLWYYYPPHGFIYTHESYNNEFLVSPFTLNSNVPFNP